MPHPLTQAHCVDRFLGSPVPNVHPAGAILVANVRRAEAYDLEREGAAEVYAP